jgi:hypothetical protein
VRVRVGILIFLDNPHNAHSADFRFKNILCS